MNRYDKEGKLFLRDLETLLSSRNVAPIDIFAYSKKLNLNVKKAHIAYEVIFIIRNSLDDIRRGLHRYSNWIKDPDQLKIFEDIGIQANNKNITRPSRIVYAFSREEKLPSYDDHVEIMQDDLRAEKEARALLDSSTYKGTIILTYTKYSETIREQAYTTIKQNIQEIPTQESIQDNVDRIPTSTSTINHREFDKSKARDSSDIYLVSGKEIKPKNRVHEDYDFHLRKERMNVIMRNPVTEAYEHTFAKSELIKRKHDTSERTLKKTKSNILPKVESIQISELRKEIEELKRLNKELTAKLEAKKLQNNINQDQLENPAQMIESKTIDLQTEINPMKTEIQTHQEESH